MRPRVERVIEVGKLLAYFGLVILGAKLLQEILLEVSRTQYIAALSRVSGLAASILDVNKNADDVIITLFALTISFLLVLPVAWAHTLSKGEAADPSLTQTLIVLSVVVAGVMLLVEDNLARSFSLVGVVAAVRFRNTLKDPRDAVYVFLSLGIGMACGLQAYHVALLLTVFECTILLVLWLFHTGAPAPSEAALLDALKRGERKGERSAAEALASLPPDARGRLEAEIEQQSRYISLADQLAGADGKRPNCVITVETTGTGAARDAVNAQLDDHRGKWRLLEAREAGGVTTLDYLGRLPKKRCPPLGLLERLRTADEGVKQVEFRSLRKLIPRKVALEPEAAEADGAGAAATAAPEGAH